MWEIKEARAMIFLSGLKMTAIEKPASKLSYLDEYVH